MDNLRFQLIDIDETWDNEVKKLNFDIYHLSGWLKASEVVDKGIAKGIIVEISGKKLLFPVIVRYIDDIYWDLSAAYGYCGPIFDKNLSNYEIEVMLNHLIVFLKEKNCVSWFIRLHPILNSEWNIPIGKIVIHGPTLSSDLTKSEYEHWTETSKGHRYAIKKAIRNNVVTIVEKFKGSLVDSFFNIYNETMKHVGASDFYFFDIDYFIKLSDLLDKELIVINAVLDGKVIASSLYLYCMKSGIMQYHLSGTLDEYRSLSPSTLINHTAREWGRKRGLKFLHFGGGVGANKDSLYEYKKGLSSQEHEFKTVRIIINEEEYLSLLEDKKYNNEDLLDGFFPLYRQISKIQSIES